MRADCALGVRIQNIAGSRSVCVRRSVMDSLVENSSSSRRVDSRGSILIALPLTEPATGGCSCPRINGGINGIGDARAVRPRAMVASARVASQTCAGRCSRPGIDFRIDDIGDARAVRSGPVATSAGVPSEPRSVVSCAGRACEPRSIVMSMANSGVNIINKARGMGTRPNMRAGCASQPACTMVAVANIRRSSTRIDGWVDDISGVGRVGTSTGGTMSPGGVMGPGNELFGFVDDASHVEAIELSI